MGSPSANSQDVDFKFGLALRAARDLHTLSLMVDSVGAAWAAEGRKALEGWEGGHSDHFETSQSLAGTNAGACKAGLQSTARMFGTKWAECRGEQDRINFARWVNAQKEDDWWGEDLVDYVYEEDHGAPPDNPPQPEPPLYLATRPPQHPEYGPPEDRDGSPDLRELL
jgi:hypothetical protein